jgi:DNA-binding CsgD family transcriptional regulator
MIVPGTATPDPLTTLSQREIEVLEWVEKGKTNEQISEILGLSQNTVKTFLKRAFIKLGVENRTAAISALRPPGGGSITR